MKNKNTVRFTAYSFVKRDDGFWISRGIIKDDQAQDWVHYDYTLPLGITRDRYDAEIGGIYELAATAALIMPSGVPTHITWRVSSDQVRDRILLDSNITDRLTAMCTTWSLELMESQVKQAADKEVEAGDAQHTQA